MATLNSLINVYIGPLFIPATPAILIVIRRHDSKIYWSQEVEQLRGAVGSHPLHLTLLVF